MPAGQGQKARRTARPQTAVLPTASPQATRRPGAASGARRVSARRPRYIMDSAREGDRLEAKTDRALAEHQLRWAGLGPGMRALDVGCGTGAVARVMAAIAGADLVTALDASAARLKQGRTLAARVDVLYQP